MSIDHRVPTVNPRWFRTEISQEQGIEFVQFEEVRTRREQVPGPFSRFGDAEYGELIERMRTDHIGESASRIFVRFGNEGPEELIENFGDEIKTGKYRFVGTGRVRFNPETGGLEFSSGGAPVERVRSLFDVSRQGIARLLEIPEQAQFHRGYLGKDDAYQHLHIRFEADHSVGELSDLVSSLRTKNKVVYTVDPRDAKPSDHPGLNVVKIGEGYYFAPLGSGIVPKVMAFSQTINRRLHVVIKDEEKGYWVSKRPSKRFERVTEGELYQNLLSIHTALKEGYRQQTMVPVQWEGRTVHNFGRKDGFEEWFHRGAYSGIFEAFQEREYVFIGRRDSIRLA